MQSVLMRRTSRWFWTLLVTLALVATACGDDEDGKKKSPADTGAGDVWTDVGDDAGIPDADQPDTDQPDADTDTGPIIPPVEYDTVECDTIVPAPTSGELCDALPGNNGFTMIHAGTVLSGTTIYKNGAVLIDDHATNARIACVGCDCFEEEPATEAALISCSEGVISPGLINPHDHITYAQSHPQPHGENRYDHRHDWRRGLRGHEQINTSPGVNTTHEGILYGELRMLFGGATSVAGSISQHNASGLLRNLDNINYTEGLTGINVDYSTFPLGDVPGQLRSEGCDYPNIQNENRAQSGIYLPHIAEGIDAEARNEFLCLSRDEGAQLVTSHTSIVHGIGLNAQDVARIAQAGARLVWSARTNIDLYGNTAPVTLFKRFGVPIALGTDWSASGSMNMLRELKCADYLNRLHFAHTFTDQEIWMMATYHAAISMGAEHKLGLIMVGHVADITIFDGTEREPYRAVIDAEIADVNLVLRGGHPLYGDANIIEGLVPAEEIDGCELLDICEKTRRLCIERDAGMTLSDVRNSVHQNSYALYFCGEPDNEPSCIPFRPTEYTGDINPTDSSGDGIPDAIDNCPGIFNPIRPMDNGVQADFDGDGIGDACDPCPLDAGDDCQGIDPNDWDGDGIPNAEDNCPFEFNPNQEDTSEDGIGDACHPCPEEFLNPGDACPSSIYDIKTGVTAVGERVSLPDVLVSAVRPGEGIFLQAQVDEPEYEGVDFSGIYVYMRGRDDIPQPGDRINISGRVNLFFGQLQLADVTNVTVMSSNNVLPEPELVTAAEVANSGTRREALEGVLIRIEDAEVTDIAPQAGPGDSQPTNEFVVEGGLRVNDFFYLIEPFPTVGDVYVSITGVLRWANENSKIEPRGAFDIIDGPPSLAGISPEMIFIQEDLTATFEVILTRAADDDMTIDLAYSNVDVVTGPTTVTVLAGNDRAEVTLTGVAASEDWATVTASYMDNSFATDVRVYGVDTPRVLESFTPEAANLLINDVLTFTVELNVPAGDSGQAVAIELDPGLALTAPAQVMVLAGELTATFDATSSDVLGLETLTASIGESSLSATVNVVDPPDVNLETFENSAANASYLDGSFVGDNGITWNYVHSRNPGDFPIDGKGIMLRRVADNSKVFSETIAGGIGSFSIEMRKAFTGGADRQLELFVNDVSYGVSEVFGPPSGTTDETIRVFAIDDINVAGDIVIEVRNISAGQITIDNLSWTAFTE